MNTQKTLDRILHPKSLALVGASSTPGKFGWLYPKAIFDIGYSGKFYPINKNADEIFGHRVYRSLSELPETPDLMVVTVPAKYVKGYLEEALEVGIPGAVVMSSGFSELSPEGAEMERELADIAERGIRIIGPNCFGIYSPKAGITVIPGAGFSRESGPVGFFSQSGGMVSDIGQMALSRGIRFSAAVSYGNAVDVDEAVMLQYLANDPDTKIISAYIEGVKDGRRFFELLTETAKKKPVVIWKSGLTDAGGRAAQSHTGSMGGDREIWDAVFAQTGVIPVRGLEEMLDLLMVLTYIHPLGGRDIAIVGGGGGLAVESADLVDLSGLSLPVFSDETGQRIGALLQGAGSSPTNPVDVGNPVVHASTLIEIMRIIAEREKVDIFFVIQFLFHIYILLRRMSGQQDVPLQSFATYPALADGIRKICETYNLPVIGVFPETATSERPDEVELELEWRKARSALLDVGAPVYPSMERAVNAVSKLADYQDYLRRVTGKQDLGDGKCRLPRPLERL